MRGLMLREAPKMDMLETCLWALLIIGVLATVWQLERVQQILSKRP